MKIDLHQITVRDVCDGYADSDEEGVVAYGGNLDIRPKYQREFVYDPKQRDAVIDTIRKGFPLNVMYWVVNDEGTYEVLDGQQRTISFCQYVNGDFSIEVDDHPRFFFNLPKTLQKQILDYTLMIYFCEGDDKEKLDWFRIVNIAGEHSNCKHYSLPITFHYTTIGISRNESVASGAPELATPRSTSSSPPCRSMC